ncbi:hypothetical protein VYA_18020 [Vibrio alfacsensis]|nr:hypothetical protein VA249_09160 [Vibrio alfacsensis]BCN24610.1 hypothetical protein VYA_18020 [Vibrio alfacsensis]
MNMKRDLEKKHIDNINKNTKQKGSEFAAFVRVVLITLLLFYAYP